MGERPVIDVHSHYVPPSYAERMRVELDRLPENVAKMLWSISNPSEAVTSLPRRIEEMDRAGVDVSVLSLPPPGVTVGDVDRRADLARLANDEFLAAADDHPGRFAVMVALPLPDVDASLAELDRVQGHGAARGVNLQAATQQGWTMDDPALLPVYQRVAEFGLPVLDHPAIEPLLPGWGDYLVAATLAPVISSSLSAARMVLSGTLDRVPGLEMIVPHLGGVLPYLAQRFADFGHFEAEYDLPWYLRNRLWYDTCSYHPPAFRCAVETCGIARLMMGTDYPVRGPIQRAVDDIVAMVEDEEERASVLGATAARWFGWDRLGAP